MPPTADLMELLLDSLDEPSLRYLLARLPDSDEIVSDLPRGLGWRECVHRCVALLAQHGAIDADLFVELALARPKRFDKIARVASGFAIQARALVPPRETARAALDALRAELGLAPVGAVRLTEDWFRSFERANPEHRRRVRGLRAAWKVAGWIQPPPSDPAPEDPAVRDTDGPHATLGAPTPFPDDILGSTAHDQGRREPASLEVRIEDGRRRGWVAVVGPSPDAPAEATLRFVEAAAALRALLLRVDRQKRLAKDLDDLRLIQRADSMVLVDPELSEGILLAIGFLSGWMRPYPLFGGLARGDYEPWLTPFIHREVRGVGPLHAALLAAEAAALGRREGSIGAVRVSAEAWPQVRGTLRRFIQPEDAARVFEEPPGFDPLLVERPALLAFAEKSVSRACHADLASLASKGVGVLAFALQVALEDASGHADDDRLEALHEVGELHLPALLRLHGENTPIGERSQVTQVRDCVMIEPTADGIRLMCARLTEVVPARLRDWLTTVLTELEARNVPARVGIAIGSVTRLSSPHAARAGHPWLFHGELLAVVQRAAGNARVEREGDLVRLRPCVTAEASRWLGLREHVEQEAGSELLRIERGAIQRLASQEEADLVARLLAPGRRVWDAVDLRPDFLTPWGGHGQEVATEVLASPFSRTIQGALSVAQRDAAWHSLVEGYLVVVVTTLLAIRVAGVGVEDHGRQIATFVALQLGIATLAALLVTRLGIWIYERFIVLRVLPVLHRYHFQDTRAEVMERASLRLRLALSAPTRRERWRGVLREAGPVGLALWWRFVVECWVPPARRTAAPGSSWPALRRPVPKGRLPWWARARPLVEDSQPSTPKTLALLCALGAWLALVIGAQLAFLAWGWLGIPGFPELYGVFAVLGVGLGALFNAALYLRLTRIDFSVLYLRRSSREELRTSFQRNRLFNFLSGACALTAMLFVGLGVHPEGGLQPEVLPPLVGLIGFTLVLPFAASDRVGVLVTGAAAALWLVALWDRDPRLAAWSGAFFGLCLACMDLVRAFVPYLRLGHERLRTLLDPHAPPSRFADYAALFPLQTALRIVEMHRSLALRTLHVISETSTEEDEEARLRLPVTRADLERAGWFLSDQHGQIIHVAGPCARKLGWVASESPGDIREIYDGGERVSLPVSLLTRHARPGQIIELSAYSSGSESCPRRPCRLFIQVINAERASAGYLAAAIPTDDARGEGS